MRRGEALVATIPSDAGAEPFFGIDRGFFAKAGLDVHLDTQSSGPAIAAAVAGGALDVGFSNTISIATAHKRGLPFTFIAPASVYVSAAPTSLLMVRKDSPLRTARDFNGKTIGANALKNIAQYAPSLWIDRNGGDSSTLRFVEMPADEQAAALEQGRIDGGMTGARIDLRREGVKRRRNFAERPTASSTRKGLKSRIAGKTNRRLACKPAKEIDAHAPDHDRGRRMGDGSDLQAVVGGIPR